MSLVARSLMRVTVMVEPFTGHGGPAGDQKTYGTAVSMPARLDEKPKLIRDARGREILSDKTVWLQPGSTAIGVNDRVTLPDGSTRPIASVLRVSDTNGQDMAKVLLG